MDSAGIVQSAWTLSRVSVDNVHTLSTLSTTPWTMSRESMDLVQGDSGQCPVSLWTLYSLSGLDPGLCPEYPWTMSRLSTDSMDNVQGVHGDCPGSQHCPVFPLIPWTMSRESMENVQGVHGNSGHFTDGSVRKWMKLQACHLLKLQFSHLRSWFKFASGLFNLLNH